MISHFLQRQVPPPPSVGVQLAIGRRWLSILSKGGHGGAEEIGSQLQHFSRQLPRVWVFSGRSDEPNADLTIVDGPIPVWMMIFCAHCLSE